MNFTRIITLIIGIIACAGLIHEPTMLARTKNHPERRKKRTEKRKCRNKRRRFGWGFLGGGAVGGLTAGVAGSAKWTPLGIVAGGLVGGGIGAATAKDCDE